ncbi:hypothetical protein GCM10010398_58750 [Streptomyces fimbriatus]
MPILTPFCSAAGSGTGRARARLRPRRPGGAGAAALLFQSGRKGRDPLGREVPVRVRGPATAGAPG